MKKLPPITKAEHNILKLLLKFRFSTPAHIQKYFKHQDFKRTYEWLNDLKAKGYINSIRINKFITSPTVYCLATKSKYILKDEKTLNENFSKYFYKEKNKSEKFINRNLTLLETYLSLRDTDNQNSNISFFNKHELVSFEHFPKDIDAYVAIQNTSETKRYFVEVLFDTKDTKGGIIFNVSKYFKYYSEGDWQAYYDNNSLPNLLLITTNERRKYHLYHYSLAKLNKSYENFSIYITTNDLLKFGKKFSDIWMEVK